MKSFLLIFAILLPGILSGQCYVGGWDVSKETVCLDTSESTFAYYHDFPIGTWSDDTIRGPYILKGDTIVFNPGVSYDTLPVLGITYSPIGVEAKKHKVVLVDKAQKPIEDLTWVEELSLPTRESEADSPSRMGNNKISISYTSFRPNMISNPLSPLWQDIFLDLPEQAIPYLIEIQLHHSSQLKNIFEGETRAVSSEEGLMMLRHTGKFNGIVMRPSE